MFLEHYHFSADKHPCDQNPPKCSPLVCRREYGIDSYSCWCSPNFILVYNSSTLATTCLRMLLIVMFAKRVSIIIVIINLHIKNQSSTEHILSISTVSMQSVPVYIIILYMYACTAVVCKHSAFVSIAYLHPALHVNKTWLTIIQFSRMLTLYSLVPLTEIMVKNWLFEVLPLKNFLLV